MVLNIRLVEYLSDFFRFLALGVPKEILCCRSRSVSLRGMNVSVTENKNLNSQDDRYMTIQQMLDHVCTHQCLAFINLVDLYLIHLLIFWFIFSSIKKPSPILRLQKMKHPFLPVLLLMEHYLFVKFHPYAESYTSCLGMQQQ